MESEPVPPAPTSRELKTDQEVPVSATVTTPSAVAGAMAAPPFISTCASLAMATVCEPSSPPTRNRPDAVTVVPAPFQELVIVEKSGLPCRVNWPLTVMEAPEFTSRLPSLIVHAPAISSIEPAPLISNVFPPVSGFERLGMVACAPPCTAPLRFVAAPPIESVAPLSAKMFTESPGSPLTAPAISIEPPSLTDSDLPEKTSAVRFPPTTSGARVTFVPASVPLPLSVSTVATVSAVKVPFTVNTFPAPAAVNVSTPALPTVTVAPLTRSALSPLPGGPEGLCGNLSKLYQLPSSA